MRCLATAVMALALVGCSTTPVTLSDSQPVELTAVLSPVYLTPEGERQVPVTIVRDKSLTGSAVTAVVLINGEPVVLLDPSDSVTIYLAPKTYLASIGQKSNLFGEPMGESELAVSDELPNTFRLRLVSGDGPRLERCSLL